MEYITLPSPRIPVAAAAQVIVAGGGPAGVCAAIAAARNGAKTILLEKSGCLGGTWTSGSMGWIIDADGDGKGKLLKEIMQKLKARNALHIAGDGAPAFNIEAMKTLLEELCQEAGVQIRLYTQLSDVVKDDSNRISAIITDSKSGKEAWQGELFIDCTGDGDLGALAGNPFEIGHPEDQRTQPMTLLALLTGLETEKIRPCLAGEDTWSASADRFSTLLTHDGYRPSYRGLALFPLGNGIFMLMANHQYERSGINADDLTSATIAARQEIAHQIEILRTRGPEWENVQLISTGAQIGVREARRLLGRYKVTLDDVVNGRCHPDPACRVRFIIDIHALSPDKDNKVEKSPEAAEFYEIPLRALMAQAIPNLLMAGRCISGDFYAHASYRVTGNATATGEAAGTLAAIAARTEKLPQQVPYKAFAEAMK
ncbi:MAG: FAD-dependent oxidoreductase [Lentisphaeria bacterium]|nr:FAD-dependent oxidoreductase [Lentisphaeria bacterium]